MGKGRPRDGREIPSRLVLPTRHFLTFSIRHSDFHSLVPFFVVNFCSHVLVLLSLTSSSTGKKAPWEGDPFTTSAPHSAFPYLFYQTFRRSFSSPLLRCILLFPCPRFAFPHLLLHWEKSPRKALFSSVDMKLESVWPDSFQLKSTFEPSQKPWKKAHFCMRYSDPSKNLEKSLFFMRYLDPSKNPLKKLIFHEV